MAYNPPFVNFGSLMKNLTPAELSALRARAHSLRPVVAIGNSGLTAAVLAEIDRSLKAHELIKVRVQGVDRAAREALSARICLELGAAPVQHIGSILVIFRENPQAEIEQPAVKKPARPRRPRRTQM